MTEKQAFLSYMSTGKLPAGFLGLDGAPANNLKWYRERGIFARWVAKNCAAKLRTVFRDDEILSRLGVAAAVRSAPEPMLKTLVAICLLESGASNAGFGKDKFGTSLAVGPMQTKWDAVMDGGIPYEGYLDIVTDRNPLIGVDAGVGFTLRFLRRFQERDAVAKYNHPGTSAATNSYYLEAYDRAMKGPLFQRALRIATQAYGDAKWLTSSGSSQGAPI